MRVIKERFNTLKRNMENKKQTKVKKKERDRQNNSQIL